MSMKWIPLYMILLFLPVLLCAGDVEVHPEAKAYFDKKFKKVKEVKWRLSDDDLLIGYFKQEEIKYEAVFDKSTGEYLELRAPFQYKNLPIKATSYIEDHDYRNEVYDVQRVELKNGEIRYRVEVDTIDIFVAVLFKESGTFLFETILINYNAD